MFSPAGHRILTGSYDHTARLWEAETGKEIAVFAGQELLGNTPFSPNGKQVVTAADQDRAARLWDGETGKEIARLEGHQDRVRECFVQPRRQAGDNRLRRQYSAAFGMPRRARRSLFSRVTQNR